MYLEIEPNGNTDVSFNMVYRDVTPAREIYCIKYPVNKEEQPVQVTGWDAETGTPCPAYACKVEESGDGIALLVYGGSGGIRMKALEDESVWSLDANAQWGESHLVLPVDSFIVYKDQI